MSMDSDDQYIPATDSDEPGFISNGGGIFPNAQHFTVAGGTFTVNNYETRPTVPPGVRMIRWEDIDLQRTLMAVNKKLGVIDYGLERRCARPVYSAKVKSVDVTVAVYQGDGNEVGDKAAEENWRRDVARYMSMRHPNIIQLCAGASYGNIHATVFHGDLVPFRQYIAPFSPIATVYLYALFANEWKQTQNNYFCSELHWSPPTSWQCTLWIRSSTGRLSVDLTFPCDQIYFDYDITAQFPARPTHFDPSNCEAIAIQSLSLQDYHAICVSDLSQGRSKVISTATSVTPGAVIYWPTLDRTHGQDVVEVASLPKVHLYTTNWRGDRSHRTEDGWMCCDAHESFNTSITRHIQSWNCHSWLTQANYIFSSLHIESDLENYVLVDDIYFTVTVPNPTGACPDGYLFLCSKEHFRVGASFKWPDVPAYWSLDPSGVERLSMEEAARLGFPRLELITKIYGMSWDTSLYAGLRQFHQAKGFNPESQDVARHLGLPLFRLSTEEDPPFAHVGDYGEEDEDWGENELSSDWPDSETDDASVDERDGTSEAPEGSGEEEKSTSGAEGLNHCNLLPGNADTDSEVRSTSPVHGSAGTSGQFHYSEDLSSLPMLHSSDEDIPVSLTFKILMNVQLVLILFLATCWVYDNLQ